MSAMPTDADVAELTQRSKRLPPADRRALIDELVISLDSNPDVDPVAHAQAWDDEIARRVAAADRGEVEWIDGAVVFAEIDALLNKKR